MFHRGSDRMARENAEHKALEDVMCGAKAAHTGLLTVRGCDSCRVFWGVAAAVVPVMQVCVASQHRPIARTALKESFWMGQVT
jgi:hypothetical protein